MLLARQNSENSEDSVYIPTAYILVGSSRARRSRRTAYTARQHVALTKFVLSRPNVEILLQIK